jgi:hypothetical protein
MKNGFYYLPLRPNSKLAAIKDYPNRATNNRKVIEKWKEDGFGLGISTSKYAEDKHLVVIDVDNKNGKNGDAEILRLELEGRDIPETYTQVTPTGGRHLVYWSDYPVKQGTNKLGPGLDIRAKGGYVVASGTTIDGKPYIDNGHRVEKCPEWLLAALERAEEREPNAGKVPDAPLDHARAVERALDYLRNHAPLAKEGEGGDQTTFRVAAKLKDFGVFEEAAAGMLLTEWNDRCVPPWSAEALIQKVHNAYRYGVKQIGSDAPEVIFDKVEPEVVPYEKWLEEMNKDYAFVTTSNGHRVLWEKRDGWGNLTVDFLPESSFLAMFRNSFAPQSTKGRIKTKAEAWLEWTGRRQYNGVGFFPGIQPKNNYYNLWRGFTCEPVPYDKATEGSRRALDLFLEHAKQNVCGGVEEHFDWVMGYFAHMIQMPHKRPLTTLVFKGSKGTGKNTLVECVGHLLGSHFVKADDVKLLVSNFNAHLEQCVLLLLDEAFWSGDKAAEGKLKSMTTSDTLVVERKGMERYNARSYVRIVVVGNEEWLVPASADERRYAVFQVGEGRKQDRRFFAEMVNLMEKGGYSVLLHYLQTFDLSKVDVNAAPKTDALRDQKEASLDPLQQWWFDSLQAGHVTGAFSEETWPEKYPKDELYNSFERVIKQRQIRGRVMTNNVFWRRLRQFAEIYETKRYANPHDTRRIREITLPALKEARKQWDKFIGHKTNWNDEDEV